nr:hypothetical protein [Neisseria sp. HSC-16F19]
MLHKKKKLTIAILGIALVPSAAMAALYGFGPAEAWTGAQLTQQAAEVSGNIISWGEGFATQMENHFEQTISAIAVATKQESVAANLIASNNVKASQQLVNAVAAQQKSDKIAEVVANYSPSTGQGHKTCTVIQKNKSLDKAFESSHVAAQLYVGQLDNAPGRLVDSSIDAMNQRYKNHLADFCTDAEAAAGLCQKSKLPGGDTNAALLFAPAKPGSLEDKAQLAYIQNVLGPPDSKVSKAAGSSAAGQDYFLAKARKDVMLSIPAYSLARIKAANTVTDAGMSPNQMLEKRTNDYFGSDEAKEWSKTLAVQAPRGLMVETLKVGGLQTWLDFQQLQQTQRINANLAALLITGNDSEKAKADSAFNNVRGEGISGGVR